MLKVNMQEEEKAEIIRTKIDNLIARVCDDRHLEYSKKQLNNYVIYLQKWSRTHNVVSRKNSVDEIWLNIYDSLVLIDAGFMSLFSESCSDISIIDAGAGGGFPGIPVAIFFPNINIILIDVNRKKCSFLRSVKANLKLDNVHVLQSKIEAVDPPQFIVSKAAFSPPDIGILGKILVTGGYLVLWASMNTYDDFAAELKKHSVFLLKDFTYDLPDHLGRSLLLFKKDR